ncbi:unnamed protein product [Leuciscus chuanchicus]
MPNEQKNKKDDEKSLRTTRYSDHDYGMDMETASNSEGKRGHDEINNSPPSTPSKGAHVKKMSKQNPTAVEVLEAIQALHSRFDSQDQKMAKLDVKLTQNTAMIANLTKSIEFNAEGVKECKEKIFTLETQMSILRKEVDEFTERSKEQDRYRRRWNLRIKGIKEKVTLDENIRQEVIRLLGEIAPEWSQKMEEYVDTVHRLGRKEDNKTRQVIVQFTKRQHRDAIWRMAQKSQVCEAAGIRFAEDLTKDDMLERGKLWPKFCKQGKRAPSIVHNPRVADLHFRPEDEGRGAADLTGPSWWWWGGWRTTSQNLPCSIDDRGPLGQRPKAHLHCEKWSSPSEKVGELYVLFETFILSASEEVPCSPSTSSLLQPCNPPTHIVRKKRESCTSCLKRSFCLPQKKSRVARRLRVCCSPQPTSIVRGRKAEITYLPEETYRTAHLPTAFPSAKDLLDHSPVRRPSTAGFALRKRVGETPAAALSTFEP